MGNKNTVELKDLRMPMRITRVFVAVFIFALIFTAIPMFSQGIGDLGQRGKELAIAFVSFAPVMLVVSLLRMKQYYVYDDGPTVRICHMDELPSYAIPASNPFGLRLSSLGCWAWVLGPRAQFWPIIKIMDIRGDEMHLQLRDAGGRCCDVVHPAVAIECVKRFNSVREITHAATQGSEEREQWEMRFRSMARELIMLEKMICSLADSSDVSHLVGLIQRQMLEVRKFLPSGLWEEALASTSDIRKAVLSSARNRITGLPGPRE